MKSSEATRILASRSDDLRHFGVTGLYLFGSTARGEAGPESDVDLFIDYDPERFGFVELIRLENFLSETLGRQADLTTREGLHPLLREEIERSAVKVLWVGQNPKRTIRARCHDMLVAIDAVANMIDDQDLAAYRSNIALRFAVERAVEIVSEASRHIPEDIRAAYPAVPWPEIAAIGNRLRHEYQRVDDTIMWGIATRSLPELRPVIHQIASRV